MRTYTEIAYQLGIDMCGDCIHEGRKRAQGGSLLHENGFASGNTVHWAERRISRSGVKRFLLLAAQIQSDPSPDRRPQWLRLWTRIQWVRSYARVGLRYHLPASVWQEEKARLAAKLAVPDATEIEYLKHERSIALRWTRR